MIFKNLAASGGARQWLLDAGVGATFALCAITAAQAALPQKAAPLGLRPAAHVDAPTAAAAATTPARPAPLIAFGEPVPGQPVVSPFGLRQLPWEEAGRLHAGVDIDGPRGAPVLAVADGVVVKTGADSASGKFVHVRHVDGLTSVYAHLGAIAPDLAPGALVRGGMAIGAIGNTGSSTGPHLHFEIRDAQEHPMNPEAFLGRSFATAADLPLAAAARIPRGVRVAYVSTIPAVRRAQMEAREKAEAGADTAAATPAASALIQGQMSRKALIAQIAAGQRAEMARAAARPQATIAGVERADGAPVDGGASPS